MTSRLVFVVGSRYMGIYYCILLYISVYFSIFHNHNNFILISPQKTIEN